jgi:hypothetical protein
MIRKSAKRFSDKIMREQNLKRDGNKPSRFGICVTMLAPKKSPQGESHATDNC